MMSAGEAAGRVVSEKKLEQWLRPRIVSRRGEARANSDLDAFIQAMRERGSLLDERGGEYRFLHLSFQEYLAAYYLAETVREVDKMVEFLEEEGRLGQSWWRETVLLTAEYLGLKSQDVALKICSAPGRLPPAWQPGPGRAELAGACFLELDSQDADARRAIVNHIVELVSDRKLTADGPLRAAAGRALASLDDPRPGVGVKAGLPDIAWSDVIAPGAFIMGSKPGDS